MNDCWQKIKTFCIAKREWLLLALLLLLALAMRLWILAYGSRLSRDSVLYIGLVRDWFETGEINYQLIAANAKDNWVPPLVQFVMTLPMHLGIGAYASCIAVSMFAGVALVGVIWMIVREASGSVFMRIAATALAALHPTLIGYSCQAQRESLYLLFCALFIWAGVKMLKRVRVRYAVAAGCSFAAAALTRYESFELLVPTVAFLIWIKVRGGASFRRAGAIAMGFFGGAALFWVIATWVMGIRWSYYKCYLIYLRLVSNV